MSFNTARTAAVATTFYLVCFGQPAWIRDGIVASSDMEALTFILRSGGEPVEAVQQWNAQRSEDAIRRFKEIGVNFSIINFHKGAGLNAEAQDIAAARQFVDAPSDSNSDACE